MSTRLDDPWHDREAGVRDAPGAPATLDTTRIDDVRIGAVRALVSPAVLMDELPVTAGVEAVVERARELLLAVNALGLPLDQVLYSPSKRPFTLADKGKPVAGLFG